MRTTPGGVFGLCMHPQVIGRGHRLDMLDALVGHMAQAGAAREALGWVESPRGVG